MSKDEFSVMVFFFDKEDTGKQNLLCRAAFSVEAESAEQAEATALMCINHENVEAVVKNVSLHQYGEDEETEKPILKLQKWFGSVLIEKAQAEHLKEVTGKTLSEIVGRSEFRMNAGCFVLNTDDVKLIPDVFEIQYV